MTNDFKEKLLAYLTGNLKNETSDNVPQFGKTTTITNNLYTYISKNTNRPYGKDIIRGKNSSGEDLDIFLLYGNDRLEDGTYKGFIVILDKNYNPIQFINKYSSDVEFGQFELLKVGDDGKFYGVEMVTSDNNRKRFVMLNNILVKSSNEINYQVSIRRAYNLDNSLQVASHTIVEILKKPAGSNYLFVDDTMIVVEFKINVGVANEWNILTNKTGLTTSILSCWASWDADNKLSFKLVNYSNNNIKIIENNSNYELYLSKSYSMIFDNSKTYMIEATMLNKDDIYLAVYYDNEDDFNYNVYIYKLGLTVQLLNRTYNNEKEPTGFSNFMYLFNDGRNAYISFNIPQSAGNRFYLGLISEKKVFFDDIGIINEYSSFFIPFISSQFNLYSFFIQNDNTGYLIKTIFNNLNYNGLSYEDINSLVPRSSNLYNENGVVIFSRNLYNKIVNNNIMISTLEIPNDMLNDEIISNEILLSETNTKLVGSNEKIETNIYETIDINFYNTINMKNDNNSQNSIINSVGASRINNSVSNSKDYDNAKATKIKINYQDDTNYIMQLGSNQIKKITNTSYMYDFQIYTSKAITNIQIISNDENTIYQTMINDFEIEKLYNITQLVIIE